MEIYSNSKILRLRRIFFVKPSLKNLSNMLVERKYFSIVRLIVFRLGTHFSCDFMLSCYTSHFTSQIPTSLESPALVVSPVSCFPGVLGVYPTGNIQFHFLPLLLYFALRKNWGGRWVLNLIAPSA